MAFSHSDFRIDSLSIPLFIISLEKDIERRDSLKKFFPANLVDNYFPAFDARNVSRQILDDRCNNHDLQLNPSYLRKLSAGEIGCTLSHRNIYKYIVENNLPFALVFEDDVLPLPDWHYILHSAIKVAHLMDSKYATLIHLGLPNYRSVGKKRIVFMLGKKFIWRPEFRFVESSLKNKFWLGHSYIITHEAAKRILKTYPLIPCMCDDWQEFYASGCFDSVILTKNAFDQNFNFDSNLRDKHPNLFSYSSKYRSTSLVALSKKIVRAILNILVLFDCSRWKLIRLENINQGR